MVYYDPNNGVKPRFMPGSSEFSDAHRLLGRKFLMFDVDNMSVNMNINLELRRENECYIENRIINGTIVYVAIFELKYRKSECSLKALCKDEYSFIVKVDMAKRLKSRLFVVYATEGKQPFEFYEIDTAKETNSLVGILDYPSGNESKRTESMQHFWHRTLGIHQNNWGFIESKQNELDELELSEVPF